jgi:hypothetical protein
MTKAERFLTWVGMWGALRGFVPLSAALVVSVVLMESLAPPVARLFSAVPVNLIHVFAVGTGLLLGLIGYFAGDTWDLLFEVFYGPKGRWLDTSRNPFLLFPSGAALKRHRQQAAQALPRKPETEDIYREAVKVARRQVERWEGIEHPLILSRVMRSLLWPCIFAAVPAVCGAVIVPFAGATREAPRFLMTAGASVALALACLVPYSRLRVEHMIRLYRDLAGHAPKKKSERR